MSSSSSSSGGPLPRSVTLSVTEPELVTEDTYTGYKVTLTVDAASGISDKLFVFQEIPADPITEETSMFSHIASPADLEEYPEDTVTPGSGMTFYRANTVTLLLRKFELLEESVRIIKSDIQLLVTRLNRLDELVELETVLIDTTVN